MRLVGRMLQGALSAYGRSLLPSSRQRRAAAGQLLSVSAGAQPATWAHRQQRLLYTASPAPAASEVAGPSSRNSVVAACLCDPEGYEENLVRGARIKFNDSSALRLRRRALLQWSKGSPSKVLIVKKPKNPEASAKLLEIGKWLRAKGLQVFVERAVWATEYKGEFDCYDGASVNVDFCITLGGDGTVLYLASLFEEDQPLPPVLCFAMGTLGFLTPFDVSAFQPCLERVLNTDQQPLYCTLRSRKRCEVVADGQLEAVHHVLNECVLDRGSFPGAVLLEIFVDGNYVTNVEADGLIISTPSGSTAYSMSAGGPVVAPSVPCTILTPIAPLSLSFRPLVIPESSSICLHLPTCARAHARASFDGKRPMRVRRGTSLFFSSSLCPLPVISLGRMDSDWYDGITSKLKWNQAIRQLPTHPSTVGKAHQAIGEQLLVERHGLEVCALATPLERLRAGEHEYATVSSHSASSSSSNGGSSSSSNGGSSSSSSNNNDSSGFASDSDSWEEQVIVDDDELAAAVGSMNLHGGAADPGLGQGPGAAPHWAHSSSSSSSRHRQPHAAATPAGSGAAGVLMASNAQAFRRDRVPYGGGTGLHAAAGGQASVPVWDAGEGPGAHLDLDPGAALGELSALGGGGGGGGSALGAAAGAPRPVAPS